MVTMNLIKAQNSLFTAYLELKDYNNALNVLNDIQQTRTKQSFIIFRKPVLLFIIWKVDMALASYGFNISKVSEEKN